MSTAATPKLHFKYWKRPRAARFAITKAFAARDRRFCALDVAVQSQLQCVGELSIADLTARQTLEKCIDFGPGRTDLQDGFPLGVLFLWVVGEVNDHFTSLVDGVLPGFGSINLRDGNPATILLANPDISERERRLIAFRLSVRRHWRIDLRISACL